MTAELPESRLLGLVHDAKQILDEGPIFKRVCSHKKLSRNLSLISRSFEV